MHRQTPKKLTVPEAAAIMGVTPQFLRMGLRHGKFPFGTAVKFKRWSYYIQRRAIFFLTWPGGIMDGPGQDAVNL